LRTILLAHAIACWVVFGVLWGHTLLVARPRVPLDGRFWLVFGLTEVGAPIWLPLSFFVYQPGVAPTSIAIASGYLVSGAIACAWLWRRQTKKIARRRRAAGACEACGYDLRGTPQRCPECGTDVRLAPAPLSRVAAH
jgi:hypothetical protein